MMEINSNVAVVSNVEVQSNVSVASNVHLGYHPSWVMLLTFFRVVRKG